MSSGHCPQSASAPGAFVCGRGRQPGQRQGLLGGGVLSDWLRVSRRPAPETWSFFDFELLMDSHRQ